MDIIKMHAFSFISHYCGSGEEDLLRFHIFSLYGYISLTSGPKPLTMRPQIYSLGRKFHGHNNRFYTFSLYNHIGSTLGSCCLIQGFHGLDFMV